MGIRKKGVQADSFPKAAALLRRTFFLRGTILAAQGVTELRVYLDLVVLLNAGVDLCLLVGTNRLCGFPAGLRRCLAAAALGGGYAAVCLLPGWRFLGNLLWRMVALLAMGAIAFGVSRSAVRRCIVFSLLTMALGGAVMVMGSGSFWSLTGAAVGIGALCILGFRGRVGSQSFVPVELCYGRQRASILALQDTGNTLCDPVTGQSVLIVGPQIAQQLVGLSLQQLRQPVETVASGTVPGLRLVPYRAVGQSAGMLTAIRMQDVRIGSWRGSTLVAFAPEGLDAEGTYQALTGGAA